MADKELEDVMDNPKSWQAWKAWAMRLEHKAAEQSVHLTALRGWLWFSICVHIITGLVLLYSAFGGR